MTERTDSEQGPEERPDTGTPSEEGKAEQAAQAPQQPSTPPPPPPPPPGAYGERPKLVRYNDDKVIAGVCSGLAAYTGTDVVWWRVGFVLAGLFTGVGLIAYIVLWIATPEARPGTISPGRMDRSPFEHRGWDWDLEPGKWIGIGAIALGIIIALRGVFGFLDFFDGRLMLGLVLVAIGVAIWTRDPKPTRNGRPPTVPPPGTPPRSGPEVRSEPTTPGAAWAAASSSAPAADPASPASAAGDAGSNVTEPISPLWPQPSFTTTQPIRQDRRSDRQRSDRRERRDSRRREPSFLGRLVFGAAALAIGVALVADNLGIANVTPKFMTAVLLGIVGLGLFIGAWAGRARWLIFPGIGLSLVLIVMAAIPFHTRGGWGDIAWTPLKVEQIQPIYEHSSGQAALDLSEIKFGRNDDVDIDVRFGFGELYIVLPDDPDVVVNARVQGGEMSLFGRVSEGWDVRQHVVDDGDAKRPATVHIDARLTFGEMHVLRGTSSSVPGLMTDRFGPNGGRSFGSGFQDDNQ